jgi:DNA-binding MltR family transcriptional regulator
MNISHIISYFYSKKLIKYQTMIRSTMIHNIVKTITEITVANSIITVTNLE